MPKDNLTVKEETNNVSGDERFPAITDDRPYFWYTKHLLEMQVDPILFFEWLKVVKQQEEDLLRSPRNIGNYIDFDMDPLVLTVHAKAAAQKATKQPSLSNIFSNTAVADAWSRQFRATFFPKPKKPEEWGDTLVNSQLDGYFNKK